MSPLERRYRRLLAAYPSGHRLTYGEEMVGVLMDSASPTQQRPSTRDTTQLLRHAVGARARQLRSLPGRLRRLGTPQWTHAAGVFAFAGALLLAARHVYILARALGMAARFPWYQVRDVPVDHAVLACAWLLTAVLAALRLPRIAAVIAIVAAAGEVADAATAELGAANAVAIPRLSGAVLVGVAAVLARRTPVPRRWSLLGLAVAAAALAASGEAGMPGPMNVFPGLYVSRPTALATAVVVLAFGWVVASLPGPVRRRVLVLATPVFGQLILFELLGEVYTGLVLIGGGALALALALLALRRLERVHVLVALGRDAEAAGTHRAAP